jgi:hypothetical protein
VATPNPFTKGRATGPAASALAGGAGSLAGKRPLVRTGGRLLVAGTPARTVQPWAS